MEAKIFLSCAVPEDVHCRILFLLIPAGGLQTGKFPLRSYLYLPAEVCKEECGHADVKGSSVVHSLLGLFYKAISFYVLVVFFF